jgi:hypothetical protein
MRKWRYLLLLLPLLGCRKPYLPPVKSSANSYLVIEGSINNGSDPTFIKLSRTVKLSGKTSSMPELNAVLTVEGDQKKSYPLTEKGNGYYACAGLNLDKTHKYRLDIKTVNGKEYVSNYESVLNSPPIDSLTFDVNGTPQSGPGLNIYVTTHDPSNKINYYRWDYQETWIFHSHFSSHYYSTGDTVLPRLSADKNVTFCWGNDTSSSIILGSSAKLTQSVIYRNPITSILSTSEKVENKYSVLVMQYALTEDAFNFYTDMKKNSEQLGNIFDALPSQSNGNLRCLTTPSEPIIGYITVGNRSSKRIFITSAQWPAWSAVVPQYDGCHLEFDVSTPPPNTKPIPCCYYNWDGANQVDEFINFNRTSFSQPFIPIDAIGPPGPIVGYTASTRICVDCTTRGTNVPPPFWQ